MQFEGTVWREKADRRADGLSFDELIYPIFWPSQNLSCVLDSPGKLLKFLKPQTTTRAMRVAPPGLGPDMGTICLWCAYLGKLREVTASQQCSVCGETHRCEDVGSSWVSVEGPGGRA